jgi:gamma-glutamylcyclotransferase (GGCT)/AIG2-like uncharacterized protein YtfP
MGTNNTSVFVYGTLLRGECNHRCLRGADFLGETRTKPEYELVDLGPYPAMIVNGKTSVVGEVYKVDVETLHRLDMLEGCPGYYRRDEIELDNGGTAFVYTLPMKAEQRKTRRYIASGSWRNRNNKEKTA